MDKAVTVKVNKSGGRGQVNLALLHPDLDNGHSLITGKTGSGKTVGSSVFVGEYLKKGISVFAIDLTDGLRIDTMPEAFYRKNKDGINIIPVYDVGLSMNLLERKEILVNGEKRLEKACDLADRITDLITETHNLGQSQQCILSETLLEALCENNGSAAELSDVCEILKVRSGQSAKSLLMKLRRSERRNIFTQGDFSWEKVLYGEPTLTIFQLSGLQTEIKKLVCDFILMDFMFYVMLYGKRDKPCVLWADECQKLNFKKGSPLYDILTLGRKFGVSAIFCSQYIHDNFDASAEKCLSMSATRLIFRPTDAECKYIAKQYGIKDENELKKLTPLECIAYGKFTDTFGNVLAQNMQKIKFGLEM